jgi:hypothetical protein
MRRNRIYGILYSPVYTYSQKGCVIESNAGCRNKFQIYNFTAKVQDVQSVNYFWLAMKDTK